jgi:hypothetical protein
MQHHALFISGPPSPRRSNLFGTLFHVKYDTSLCTWILESFHVHLESFKTLSVLWQIATLQMDDPSSQLSKAKKILTSVPLELKAGVEYSGKHESGVYDCIVWITTALETLLNENIIPRIDKNIGM